MKKIISIVVIIVFISIGIISLIKYFDYKEEQRIKNAIIKVELIDNLDIEFNSKVYLSDLLTSINGELIKDYKIDTLSLGVKKIKFKYINEEKIKVPYEFSINIVDKTPPIIWLSSSLSLNVGYTGDLLDKIMCGDNYDSNPTKEIIGEYNLNQVGTYPLVYKASDSSGNIQTKKFNLIVKNKASNSTSSKKTISFSSIYSKYKNESTKIGLDVSKWQGDIDYKKVKNAGVEFVFIKIGGTNGINGDYYMDPKFKDNIEGFLKEGIPVGLYFYSYANSYNEAVKEAKWVIENIKDYPITFPIAFDWENWSSFNKFKMSFYELTNSAKGFIDTINKAGYEGILYSSKSYLESIWLENDFPIWLAHYTDKTNYQGNYRFWQMTSSCKIDGITANTVDVNIMYLNN